MSATSQPADPWKSHKAKASSLSVLWNPIKRVPLGTEGGGGGGGMQSGIRYISSPIHSLDADGHGNGNGTGFVFPVQVQADQLSGSTMDTASTPVRAAVNTNSKGNGTIMSSPASSPSSVEKKRAYSLRKIFLHRKSNSTHSPLSTTMSTGFNNSDNASPPPALSPSISAPWGLTVASFRPAPVPHHHHHYGQASLDSSEPIPQQQQQPDLRELRLEDTMLVSRESDSNGLLAQQRARDMPVPQEAFFSPPRPQQQQQQQAQQQQHRQGKTTALTRSTSLGNPLTTTTTTTTTTRTISSTTTTTAAAGKTPERPKRYEASTLCEKFILPRPRLVAHSITPPTSPTFHLSAPPPFSPPQPQMQLQPQKQKQQQETTTDSYAQQPEVARIGRRSALLVYEEEQRRQQRAAGAGSPALSVLSGTRVLQEGKERDWEREEWAARAGAARASSLSAAAIGGGGGGAGRLRMRLASTTRDGDRERDTRYLQARFAPMPVAYERVQGGGHLEVQKREAEQEEEMVSPPLGGRKKSRSGSLGDLLAGPFMRRDRGAVDTANEGTVSDHSGKRLLEPVRTSSSSQQHHHHRQQRPRRSSEPSLLATLPVAQPSSSSSSRFTFLRQLTQSPHSKAPQLHHARVASLPMVMALNMDKPLPPDPVETDSGSSSDAGGGEKRRSRVVRYSASSPDLRSLGLVDLPPVLAPSHGQMGSRNSALNLLSRSDVVDRLAHPLTDGHGTSSGRRFPPSPIQVVADSAEETGTMAQEEGEGQGPFTPTRQAAWEQWHTSTIQLRSPDSPLPERLPAETVRKLAERQAKSPRQKKPSMEEAVNRARIAKQLFGDLPSSPTPPPPPLPVPHSPNVEGYQHSHVGSTSPTVATSWQHDRLLYAAFTGNHSPHSPRRYGEGSGSPQRTRLAPPTPGSTEASPMPGASFEDIERDLFFSRPRRLWGTPVALPSRNGDEHVRIPNGMREPNVLVALRQSKDSAPGSFPSPSTTRIVSTSDESSHDAHGNVEIATPNLSQNDGHHDKARFPAILEEEGRSDTSDSSDRVLKGDDGQSFNDHRWLQKGFLPRDTSSNTILNFHEIEARQPKESRLATNVKDGLGKTSIAPDRSSVVPESGRLDASSDDDDSTRSLALISQNGHKGFPAVPSMAPVLSQNDSAYSSVSDINSFVSARSTATVKAPAEHPVFSRQDTDLTTRSYATAASRPL